MPIDNSAKGAKFVTDVVRETENLLAAQEALTNLAESKTASGLDLATLDFAGNTTIKHVDNQSVLDALNSVNAINTLLAAGHATNLNKVRP